MCLIIALGKGTDKYSELVNSAIKNSMVGNSDGMGYAYKRASTKKVYISKGYKNFDKIWMSLMSHELKPNDELIIHLRNGNKGSINSDMCHPFIISPDSDEVTKNKGFTNKPVLVHNGTFFDFSVNASVCSDTFFFARDFMAVPEILKLLKRDTQSFKKAFSSILRSNKLAFLFPNESRDMLLIGEYESEKGVYFSNQSYKNRNLVDRGGYQSSFDYGRQSFNGKHSSYSHRDQSYYDGLGWDDEYDEVPDDSLDLEEKNEELLTTASEESNIKLLLKSGYKKTGDAVNDLIPPKGAPFFIDPVTKTRFTGELGIYIPGHYQCDDQMNAIRFEINEFNFTDLTFFVLEKNKYGLEKYASYTAIQYGDKSSADLHTLIKNGTSSDSEKESGPFYADADTLLKYTKSFVRKAKTRKYYDCAYLMTKLPLTDKTLDAANTCLEYTCMGKSSTDSITFMTEIVRKEALELFVALLTKKLYSITYRQRLMGIRQGNN